MVKVPSKFDGKKIRKYLIYAIVVSIAYFINPKLFLMIIFIGLTMWGKIVRGQIANNMLMFDPLVFFSICIQFYWGFKFLFLYLFIVVFVADAISGTLSAGSLLNYFLFHFCPYICYVIFGAFDNIHIFGNATAILYSVSYTFIRVKYLAGVPMDTTVKGVTNVLFVYLYLVFISPIMGLVMGGA